MWRDGRLPAEVARPAREAFAHAPARRDDRRGCPPCLFYDLSGSRRAIRLLQISDVGCVRVDRSSAVTRAKTAAPGRFPRRELYGSVPNPWGTSGTVQNTNTIASSARPRPGPAATTGNRILAALTPEESRILLPQLEAIPLVPGRVVQEEGEPIEWLLFPTSGVISLIARLSDGRAIESTAVGIEGASGIPAFLANAVSPVQGVVQVRGSAFRIAATRLRREAVAGTRARILLHRYSLALFASTSQAVACIRFHHVIERCARWLLTTHDSVPEGTFEMTHEFLATLLGVRRAGVSEAVGMLTDRGLIRSERGRFTILDRAKLATASCECYRVIRQELDAVYR